MYDGHEPRTAEEAEFLDALFAEVTYLMIWPHEDPTGEQWLCLSTDFVEDGVVHDTLRLDFDGTSIVGGWSPSFLNGDDGFRAHDAGIDTGPPDGINVADESPAALAQSAADWFRKHEAKWPTSERQARWYRPGLPPSPIGDPDGPWYGPK
jgi:hypothetical protein